MALSVSTDNLFGDWPVNRRISMKYIVSILFFTFFVATLSGQRNADWGVSGGVMTYVGEINHGNLLHSPGPAAGFFYRYNLHPRHSLRAGLLGGRLSANDLGASNNYQLNRGASFSGFTGEMGVQFEFNFFPYSTSFRKVNYTPYIAGGAAVAFINTEVFTYTPAIPLTAGFKINFLKNFGLEIEYGFRKTFYDNFDGLIDPIDPDHHTWMHNNDWYMFGGFSFTWKMYRKTTDCPAYGEPQYPARYR